MSDMRTPLSRVRGLGSARSGTGHFWQQRLSAIALIPLTLFLVGFCLKLVGADYATARSYLAMPVVSISFLLLIIAGIHHMRLGMQVIIEDYVHHEGLKMLALIGNVFFPLVVGLSAAYAVIKLGFGA